MMTTAERWLTAILDCGIADLSILSDVKYDIDDILGVVWMFGERLSLDNVMAAVFEIARRKLQEAIDERINEIENELDESECNADAEYRALLSLDPWEDIREYHNYLDTRVWFESKGDLYAKYVKEACNTFEQDTGYSLFD